MQAGKLHILLIPIMFMASVNIFIGIYYLILYFKRPQVKEHLPFSFLCVSVALYDVLCIGLYNSLSVEQGVFWQRLQFYTIPFITVFFVWFISIFTEQENKRIIKLSAVWFLLILIASYLVNPELSISSLRPAIKHINFFDIIKITYYEASTGIIFNIEALSFTILCFYLVSISIRYYMKSKNNNFLPVIISMIIYFLCVISDTLVVMQVYSFIYVSEYAYFFIIMAMAYMLLSKFVSVQTAFEELNNGLERNIQERIKENNILQNQLHQ